MKVKQIISEITDRDIKRAVGNLAQQSKEWANSQITPEQIEIAYKKLSEANRGIGAALSVEEINDLAQELAENVGRTKGSWEFILMRLHILVFGMVPYGVSESRAERMFGTPSKAMIAFADGEGIDVADQISAARAELKTRPKPIKYDEAKSIMAKYYMANKASLPKNIGQYREEIIERLMKGMAPEQAFDVA